MSHSVFRDRLIALASGASGDPTGFLDGLSDIHDDWHGENVRTYGFLTFHHRVVRYFKSIVNSSLAPPIAAYTAAELTALGVTPYGGNLANVDTLGELRTLATSIENWHNTAHMTLGAATGAPMMDARVNIFYRPFWQLHFYIEDMFLLALNQYGNRNHPGSFLNVNAVASHIEAGHHSWVRSI